MWHGTERDRGDNRHSVNQIEQLGNLSPGPGRAAADSDDDPFGCADGVGRALVAACLGGRAQGGRRAGRQFVQVELLQCYRLHVHRHEQEERTAAVRVIYGVQAAAQGGGQRPRRVQTICLAHRRVQLEEEVLLLTRDLLHVGAFVFGRLVAQQVPHPQAVSGCDQRGGQRMQRARPDRRDHRGLLSGQPTERGRRV